VGNNLLEEYKIMKLSSYADLKSKINSWNLVQKNGWVIKISMIDTDSILLVVASRHTGQSFVMYSKSEEDSCNKILSITKQNARELIIP
jgi:hypothetical protein